ncbi:hypothetical protein G6F62_015693 [Rhizopus arrhizus]|nr:hypothetical protein G6F62_015693 [Rhizopus arrhizus]
MACHHAATSRQFIRQITQFAADLPRPQRQQPPFVGQRRAAPRPVDQPDAQALFQRVQPLRDGRRRHVQGARRLRQGRGGRQGHEKPQVVGGDHSDSA